MSSLQSQNKKINDYRTQIIKDIPIRFKATYLSYKQHRYQCKNCGKTFYEQVYFLAKRGRKTTRVTEFIIERLTGKQSMKDIAKDANVSSTTVARLLPLLAVYQNIFQKFYVSMSLKEIQDTTNTKFLF